MHLSTYPKQYEIIIKVKELENFVNPYKTKQPTFSNDITIAISF